MPAPGLSYFFEGAAQLCGKPQAAANWIANDLLRELAAAQADLADSKIRPEHIAALVQLVETGVISNTAAKEVFHDMFQSGDFPEAVVERKGLKQSTDTGALEEWVRAAIAANPKAVVEFKTGNERALNAIKGAVMKASAGKANPKLVDEIVRRQLG